MSAQEQKYSFFSLNSTNLTHTKDWNQVTIAWTLLIQSSIILFYYLPVCTRTVSLISQGSNQIFTQNFYFLFNIQFPKFLLWPAKIYLALLFLILTANGFHLSSDIILNFVLFSECQLILYFAYFHGILKQEQRECREHRWSHHSKFETVNSVKH